MGWKQTYTPRVTIGSARGWCLKYIDDAGNAPTRRPNARAALNAEIRGKRLRTSAPPVGIWVVGFLDLRAGQWAGDDHVFFMKNLGNGRYELRDSETQAGARSVYRNITEILNWFGYYSPAYVGWSPNCDGRQYARYEKTVPKPPAKGSFKVVKQLNGYRSATDAKARRNSNSKVPAGTYHTFNTHNGMRNITRKAGTPGWWINPADNVSAPKAVYYTVKRGDTMSGIAAKHKLSLANLAKLNPSIKNLNLIRVGQKVRVK